MYDAANVAELAYARRLDEDAIRMELFDQLIQRIGEVAHQRTANASRIQFCHLNAGVLHKAAVNANFAIFVFQKNDLFPGKSAV